MVIVWRGFGWLVPLIFLIAMFGAQSGVDALSGTGYYADHSWPKYVAVILASMGIGVAGYWFNYKRRKTHTSDTGERVKAPSHSLLFIPIEFWALIVPVIAFALSQSLQQDLEHDQAYLGAPQAGDAYVVDVSKTFQQTADKYKYGVLMVQSVNGQNVTVKVSKVAYNKSSGPSKDIRDGKTRDAGYFGDEKISFTTGELKDMRKKDAILYVRR